MLFWVTTDKCILSLFSLPILLVAKRSYLLIKFIFYEVIWSILWTWKPNKGIFWVALSNELALMVMFQCTQALTLVSPPLSSLWLLVKGSLPTPWHNVYHRVRLCFHQQNNLLDWIFLSAEWSPGSGCTWATLQTKYMVSHRNHFNTFLHRKVTS